MFSDNPPPVEPLALTANRFVAITKAPFAIKNVSLRWLKGQEQLGEPFSYRLRFIAKDPVRNLGQVPGEAMTVSMLMADRQTLRHFNGIVTAFEYVGIEDTRRLNYEVELKPWLSLLALRRTSRIFHNQTSLEIVRQIFAEHGGTFRVRARGRLPRRDVCVQYDETDLAFVSRLLEQDGIYYFFEHTASQHTLVLADDPADHKPCSPENVPTHLNLRRFRYSDDVIWRWRENVALTPGRVALRDYDHEKPNARLDALEPVPDVVMGDVRGTTVRMVNGGAGSARGAKTATRTAPESDETREVFRFPGRFATPADGAFYARREAEQIASSTYRVFVEGSPRQVTTGCRFRAENPYDQPDMELIDAPSRSWLAIGLRFEVTGEVGDNGETRDADDGEIFLYKATVEAQSSETPFRPKRHTPWPRIVGPQTAEVFGPAGTDIATDELGRVRLRFCWERKDVLSGWVRVGQSWAGKSFGGLVIPRVGQEVLVHFHDGNPDWPVITGAVYNMNNLPAEDLPARATRSSFRSRSVSSRGARSYNELRFDDAAGAEEILLRAERDLNLKAGDTHRINAKSRFVLSVGGSTGRGESVIEVGPDGIRLSVSGAGGAQGLEITPTGIMIQGKTVALSSTTLPVTATPAIMPLPQLTPAHARAAVALAISPADSRIDD